jgi:hypothetical protein
MTPIIQIGKDKDGDFDFSISTTIGDLNYEQMSKFRAMIVVAIGSAEDMWRRAKQLEPEQQTSKTQIN